jgi:hypothetical protein
MTFLLIVFVVMVLGGGLLLRRGNQATVNLGEIPAVFEKIRTTGKEASFATFCFGPVDMPAKGDSLNVQFSIEQGRIGFDWILISQSNIRDRNKFLDLAQRRGHQATEHKAANGCEYLRVEDGNLVALCVASMRELYGLPEDGVADLVWQGFDWP